MKERPIIFQGEMVRAILDGRKTQTRRPIKPQPENGHYIDHCHWNKSGWAFWKNGGCTCVGTHSPPAFEGDRLWVRETFGEDYCGDFFSTPKGSGQKAQIVYRADGHDMSECGTGWRPSIHMPREASRITLEVTEVRVERVQDISEEDARAEGPLLSDKIINCTYRDAFMGLWDSIYQDWVCNRWVWVVRFKVL